MVRQTQNYKSIEFIIRVSNNHGKTSTIYEFVEFIIYGKTRTNYEFVDFIYLKW